MLFDENVFCQMLDEASRNERLRIAKDLRNSPEDNSQRILNALIPGTKLPTHRHLNSSETVIVLYGSLIEVYYDDNGKEIERFKLTAGCSTCGLVIPQGQWHNIIVEEPCVIFEGKDGKYKPLIENEILRDVTND